MPTHYHSILTALNASMLFASAYEGLESLYQLLTGAPKCCPLLQWKSTWATQSDSALWERYLEDVARLLHLHQACTLEQVGTLRVF